jgi:hypothetical protein
MIKHYVENRERPIVGRIIDKRLLNVLPRTHPTDDNETARYCTHDAEEDEDKAEAEAFIKGKKMKNVKAQVHANFSE